MSALVVMALLGCESGGSLTVTGDTPTTTSEPTEPTQPPEPTEPSEPTADTAVRDTATDPLTACEGAGPASFEVGEGAFEDFVAWGDGATAVLGYEATRDEYGFRLEFLTDGLDTRETIQVFLSLTPEGHSQIDYVVPLIFQCIDGPGWVASFASLPVDLQSETAVKGMDGDSLELSAKLIDVSDDEASHDLDLVIDTQL